ncbi:4-hydroxybenzoate 3-monooxygenase [Actinomycetospora sp. NBRC 106375]|uniref:FAD-dependent monooxygenase n=1 Tax=Actinomycetospora sp. NBRC 106375 TaxID=3032207 RepID=UPI0024A3B8A3|nr:FAD-dependent monooxygenase [Actinomycetospora sp. NBRC 106375]GLZ45440.1 4-hydroxybenzoate 3-monooxygenase [Actinomycetospora sp. NBRC 106375]
MRTEIVVVGAGPAGLVLAWLLQRAGIDTVVVEQQPAAELGKLPKAGIVEHRTVELLTAEGLAPEVLPFSAVNRRCEFRTAEESVLVDYAEITGGRPHWVFPQHELVARLAASYRDAGGTVLFERRVTGVEQDADGARVVTDQEEITGDVVVGCDGAGSAVARSLAGHVTRHERQHPMRMLVISAAMPPLVDHTIYAVHPRGYAAHMRRLPEITRLYLEIPRDESPADWPAPRVRGEVGRRLGVGDALGGVELPEVDVIDLRVRVTTPMQHGRVFLVGDAAHLITQAGGKGMNLAIADALELAHGLVERHAGDPSRVADYSATRLPAIWRTEAFSDWFLHIMCAPPRGDGERDGFGLGLREGWVSSLRRDPLLRRWFAHAYAGVDPD